MASPEQSTESEVSPSNLFELFLATLKPEDANLLRNAACLEAIRRKYEGISVDQTVLAALATQGSEGQVQRNLGKELEQLEFIASRVPSQAVLKQLRADIGAALDYRAKSGILSIREDDQTVSLARKVLADRVAEIAASALRGGATVNILDNDKETSLDSSQETMARILSALRDFLNTGPLYAISRLEDEINRRKHDRQRLMEQILPADVL